MTWHGVRWHGVAWRGVAWRGVAWRGVVWHGMVWHGMAYATVVVHLVVDYAALVEDFKILLDLNGSRQVRQCLWRGRNGPTMCA